jgi:hypothetical protein
MKKALIVGINYTGTSSALKGCINDANNIKNFLVGREFTDITMVLEKEATTARIIAELNKLITGVVPGDVIVFHYSGHGSQLPSKSEPDGFEEIICPIDLNWMDKVITDKTLRDIFNKVPNGVNITLILDCCHSGTMLNQTESMITTKDLVITSRPKKKSKEQRYLKPPAKIVKQLANRQLVDWQTSRDVNATALLIAGCRADQTSADAFIDGVPQGAATASLLKAVASNPTISYRTLVTNMRDYMSANKFSQLPQLDGAQMLYDHIFIQPFPVANLPIVATITDAPIPVNTSLTTTKISAVLLSLVMLILFITIFA